MAVRGRAADDRRGVRPVGRRRRHHQRPGGVDARLQPAPEPVARRGARPRGLAGGRVLQRLPGDEDQDPELPDHAELVLHAHRHQPGGDQAGHRAGRHPERHRHGTGSTRRKKVFASLVRRSAACRSRITVVWWSLFTAIATWVLFKTRIGNWIFAVGGNQDSARAVGVPVTKVKIGLFMTVGFVRLVRRHAPAVLVQHRAVRRRASATSSSTSSPRSSAAACSPAGTAPRSAPRSARSSSA